MKEDKLGDLSMELSVEVLKLTKELRSKHETVISNQIGRSATSICANIAESKYAHSRAFSPTPANIAEAHLRYVPKRSAIYNSNTFSNLAGLS